ncbi:MAG TPA: glycosyltransferase family 87 protein, partial [Candidatus Sulfotelmatobacter sp.]|nr:glycosyltransferase family 87 protein [Candidatus Sulfotelmatobacter sp.]
VLIPTLASMDFRPTGLGAAYHWLTNDVQADSWLPIMNAMDYIATHGPADLYRQTYYDSDYQFIYPPTSLVFVSLVTHLGLIDWRSIASLQDASWWAVPAAMITLTTITCVGLLQVGARIGVVEALLAAVFGIVATLLFYPFMRSASVGNIQAWLSLLLMIAILSWMVCQKAMAGLALGLVCVIKPQLGLIVLWAALRREWSFVAALTSICAAFVLASILMFGWQVQEDYFNLLRFLSSRGESFYANQSINGLLNRVLFIGNNLTWDGSHTQITYDARVHLLTVITSVALISLILLYRCRAVAGPLDFGFALVGLTLASPVAYDHHFGFLPAVFLPAMLALHARLAGLWAYMLLAV